MTWIPVTKQLPPNGEIVETKITRIKIDNTDIFLEDFEQGQGKITISDTYGHNYSYYWGSMGRLIKEFIPLTDSGYFASKLMGSKSNYVMDCRKTFAAIRKFIATELDLPWYKHIEFQKSMREVLKQFQRECEANPTQDYFVSRFYFDFIQSLCYLDIEGWEEQKKVEKNFDSISECWHFIVVKESPEYLWLTALHKKLVKKLNPHWRKKKVK